MNEQGCSTLPANEHGVILERLVGLEKVISPQLVEQALQATGRTNGRRCILTHEVMLWVVLGMGLLTNMPIQQVFRHSRRGHSDAKCPARSSLCAGRQRLGLEPLKYIFEHVVRPLATPETPGAFYRQWRLVAMDGTVLDVPDSEANQVFGRSSGGRGEGAFPQVRKVSLVECGTHVELAFAAGGWHDSERELSRTLWDKIPADALLLQDRGFFCYEDWKALESRVKLLVRVKSNMVFTPIQRLADGSYLAKIYPTPYHRLKDRDGIVVRVIEYTLNDPQRTGHGERHRLITNLLDEVEAPALELIDVYHERWEVELVYDEQKTHQDPRRAEKPAQLRSESPDGVRQELYALSLGHFVTRALMFEAAKLTGLDPRRLSFKGCFQILECRLPECETRSPVKFSAWYECLLAEMATTVLPVRRNRINPRVIKRKMSKWPKKRAHHKHPPLLTQTFTATIVDKT